MRVPRDLVGVLWESLCDVFLIQTNLCFFNLILHTIQIVIPKETNDLLCKIYFPREAIYIVAKDFVT